MPILLVCPYTRLLHWITKPGVAVFPWILLTSPHGIFSFGNIISRGVFNEIPCIIWPKFDGEACTTQNIIIICKFLIKLSLAPTTLPLQEPNISRLSKKSGKASINKKNMWNTWWSHNSRVFHVKNTWFFGEFIARKADLPIFG